MEKADCLSEAISRPALYREIARGLSPAFFFNTNWDYCRRPNKPEELFSSDRNSVAA
jgi:hypothetical protein